MDSAASRDIGGMPNEGIVERLRNLIDIRIADSWVWHHSAMPRPLVLLLTLLPHGCCLLALASGYWSSTTTMPCHGDPRLYPAAELGGLLLAAAFLLALWRVGPRALRALALALVVSCGFWLADLELPNQILLSAVSKASQGFILLQFTLWLLRRQGWQAAGRCCC